MITIQEIILLIIFVVLPIILFIGFFITADKYDKTAMIICLFLALLVTTIYHLYYYKGC